MMITKIKSIVFYFCIFGGQFVGWFIFYRTHVHMGSDHWVAMSVQHAFYLEKALVKDPS